MLHASWSDDKTDAAGDCGASSSCQYGGSLAGDSPLQRVTPATVEILTLTLWNLG